MGLKSWDTVHKWTKGKYIPKGTNLAQLADILQVSTDYILLGRGEHENGPFYRYNEIMQLPVKDRAWPIAQAAAEKNGISGFMTFFEGTDAFETPVLIQRFLDGEFNEEDFYKEACRVFEDMGKTIRDKFTKRGF